MASAMCECITHLLINYVPNVQRRDLTAMYAWLIEADKALARVRQAEGVEVEYHTYTQPVGERGHPYHCWYDMDGVKHFAPSESEALWDIREYIKEVLE